MATTSRRRPPLQLLLAVAAALALGGFAQREDSPAKPAVSVLRTPTGQGARPIGARKCLLITTFDDGRAWFRTTGLSRVKHGVRGASRPRNACKSAQIVATISDLRWA